MNIVYPIVIGTVIFTYIQSFNRFAKLYKSSGNTLDWNDFIGLLSYTRIGTLSQYDHTHRTGHHTYAVY